MSTQLLALDHPCEDTLAAVTLALAEAGLEVKWSFDLQSARTQVPGCSCPYHGKQSCDCQYMVLLVYGSGWPATLIVHGHNQRSWVILADRPIDPDLEIAIVRTLLGSHPALVQLTRKPVDVS